LSAAVELPLPVPPELPLAVDVEVPEEFELFLELLLGRLARAPEVWLESPPAGALLPLVLVPLSEPPAVPPVPPADELPLLPPAVAVAAVEGVLPPCPPELPPDVSVAAALPLLEPLAPPLGDEPPLEAAEDEPLVVGFEVLPLSEAADGFALG
jgi:hypothetical protein